MHLLTKKKKGKKIPNPDYVKVNATTTDSGRNMIQLFSG